MLNRAFHSFYLFPVNEGLCSFMLCLTVAGKKKKSFPSKPQAHRDKIIASFKNKRAVGSHLFESGLVISEFLLDKFLDETKAAGGDKNDVFGVTTSFQNVLLGF